MEETDLRKALRRELPGEIVASAVVLGEGPVLTETTDGSYHVSYIVVECCDPEAAPRLEIRYQESFSDGIYAGMEYQELKDYAPGPEALGVKRHENVPQDLIERKLMFQEGNKKALIEGVNLEDLL